MLEDKEVKKQEENKKKNKIQWLKKNAKEKWRTSDCFIEKYFRKKNAKIMKMEKGREKCRCT